MANRPNNAKETMESPARNLFAITPSDVTRFDVETRGLWVGVGGTIVIVGVGSDNTSVALLNVGNGTMLPIRAVGIDDTNTTATDIVGLY